MISLRSMTPVDWGLVAAVGDGVGEAARDEGATRLCAWATVVLLSHRNMPNSATRATIAAKAAIVMNRGCIVKISLVSQSLMSLFSIPLTGQRKTAKIEILYRCNSFAEKCRFIC